MELDICPACGCDKARKSEDYETDTVFFTCPVCGRFELSESAMFNKSLDLKRLGSFLFYKGFRRNKDGKSEPRYYTTISKEKCDEYVAEYKQGHNNHGYPVHMDNEIIDAWYPKSFAEKTNMILAMLDEFSDYIGQEMNLSQYELSSLMFAVRYNNTGEKLMEEDIKRQTGFFVEYLIESGYIECSSPVCEGQEGLLYITPKGYQRIDQLQRNSINVRDALVAMKFGIETNKLRESIKQGIREAGYNPILIDEVEHNELITPELLNCIKNSRFVVVDLSHKNNGAYFEEGYAMGLGKPVIQLCKNGTELHFDIAQKNTIIWENEEDIPLRLKNRIRATID